jgi:hypothetical protein
VTEARTSEEQKRMEAGKQRMEDGGTMPAILHPQLFSFVFLALTPCLRGPIRDDQITATPGRRIG